MRIAHVVYECEPGRFIGGVQKMVYELARAQAARGDVVEILTIGDRPELSVRSNLRIRYFPGKFHWGSQAIREALFREHDRFDVIHAHNSFLPLNRVAAAAARRFSKAVFFHAHGAFDPVLLQGWNWKALKKRIYINLVSRSNFNLARGLIGLTGEECRQLKLLGVTTPLYEVGNGIEPQPAATAEEIRGFCDRLGLVDRESLVVFVGRITAKKGIHHLIEAMPTVCAAAPSARLVICGDREMDPRYTVQLDALIERHRLGGIVHWAGFLDERGKRGALGAARVFAHPSESEGMALAILEAMSFGVPSVVTPGCYMHRAVAAGALKEVRPEPKEIGEAIALLLRDETKHAQMSRIAAAYVRGEHSWPALAQRLDGIYRGQPDKETVFQATEGTDTAKSPAGATQFMSEQTAQANGNDGIPARELFDSIATTWEDKYHEDGSMIHRKRRFCEMLRKHVPQKTRLLDFGCASGDLSSTFSQAGYRVSGIDQAPAMIKRAEARFGATGIDFKLLRPEEQGRVVLPFPDGEFSAIVASSVAEYLVPLSAYLQEWHRVAAPRATLLVTVPNPMHPLRWLESGELLMAEFSLNPFGKQSDRARYLQTSVNRSGAWAWRKILAESGWTWLHAEGWSHPLLLIVARKEPVGDKV